MALTEQQLRSRRLDVALSAGATAAFLALAGLLALTTLPDFLQLCVMALIGVVGAGLAALLFPEAFRTDVPDLFVDLLALVGVLVFFVYEAPERRKLELRIALEEQVRAAEASAASLAAHDATAEAMRAVVDLVAADEAAFLAGLTAALALEARKLDAIEAQACATAFGLGPGLDAGVRLGVGTDAPEIPALRDLAATLAAQAACDVATEAASARAAAVRAEQLSLGDVAASPGRFTALGSATLEVGGRRLAAAEAVQALAAWSDPKALETHRAALAATAASADARKEATARDLGARQAEQEARRSTLFGRIAIVLWPYVVILLICMKLVAPLRRVCRGPD